MAHVFGTRRSRSLLLKRGIDIMISSLGLLLASPVLATIAVLVAFRLGRPVLFTQLRPGLHCELFRIVKFRTMRDLYDAEGNLLPDSERLTRFGRILRATSLDELPELINVLRGDMSLVGPRPLLKEYLPLYTPDQRRRHDVRPGITGWSQVNGRNNLAWPERFALDVWYVDHRSFWLDLKIIARTLLRVVSARDVVQEGQATMELFRGNQ